MTPESTLPVIAQIAATFAGFTALVSAVDQSQDGRWARISIWRVLAMLKVSLTLLFLCLLPAILLGLGIPTPLVWQIALGIVLAIGVFNLINAYKMTKGLSSGDGPTLNQTIRKATMTLGVSTLVLQAAALTGLFPLDLSGVYLLSMTISLMTASLIFFALIQQLDLQRIESEPPGEDEQPS